MTEEELRELEGKKISAEIAREEAEIEKVRLESARLEEDLNRPFYSSKEFLRPLIAGISLALLLAGYVQYIFLPAQMRLSQQAETAEFVLQQNTARHSSQMAALQLVKTRVEDESRMAKLNLENSEASLAEALEHNNVLLNRIRALGQEHAGSDSLKVLEAETLSSGDQISAQLAVIGDQKLQIDELVAITGEIGKVSGEAEGWMYIGYYPKDVWNYRTVSIESGLPEIGNEYLVAENVNLRNQHPKLTLFGYDYGEVSSFLVPGQSVIIDQTKEIGRSKIWAYIRVMDTTN